MEVYKKVSPITKLLATCGLFLALTGCRRSVSNEAPFHQDHEIIAVAADPDTCSTGKTSYPCNSDLVLGFRDGAELLNSNGQYINDFYYSDGPAGETVGVAMDTNRMYVATKGEGIFVYNRDGELTLRIGVPVTENGDVLAIARGANVGFFSGNVLFVQTSRNGILRFSTNGQYLNKIAGNMPSIALAGSASQSTAGFLLTDDSNVLQIDADGNEIARIAPRTPEGAGAQTALATRDFGLFSHHRNIYIGTSSGEVDRFDAAGNLTLRIGADGVSGPITGLATATNNDLAIAHHDGVEVVDIHTGKHEHVYAVHLHDLPRPPTSSQPAAKLQ